MNNPNPRYSELSDRELMRAYAQTGDRDACAALVTRWDGRVFGYLAKCTGDVEAAKDLRQEVFLRLYRYGNTYDDAYAFTTWFFRIVSNVLATWKRSNGRLHPVSIHGLESRHADHAAGPSERAHWREVGDFVRAALDRLTPEDRELLLLRLDLERSYREIGEIVGAPETTVKSRIYLLFAGLRNELKDTRESRTTECSSNAP